jgi:organic hydroperoxide reductase OsmC/OhrA
MEFQAGIKWRNGRFGEVFVGEEKQSRGLVNPPPVFGGFEGTYSAEDMLLAALASCQMTSFLFFVDANGINLISYENNVTGTLTKGKGGFSYTHFKIDVDVVVASGHAEKAEEAIELSKRFCIVSNSLKGEEEYNINISES